MNRIVLAGAAGPLRRAARHLARQPGHRARPDRIHSAIYRLAESTCRLHTRSAAIRPLKSSTSITSSSPARSSPPTSSRSLSPASPPAICPVRSSCSIGWRSNPRPVSRMARSPPHATDLRPGPLVAYGGRTARQSTHQHRLRRGPARIHPPPRRSIPFLSTLVQSVPWNAAYKLRLGRSAAGAGDNRCPGKLLAASPADPQRALRHLRLVRPKPSTYSPPPSDPRQQPN